MDKYRHFINKSHKNKKQSHLKINKDHYFMNTTRKNKE